MQVAGVRAQCVGTFRLGSGWKHARRVCHVLFFISFSIQLNRRGHGQVGERYERYCGGEAKCCNASVRRRHRQVITYSCNADRMVVQ